MPELPQRWFVTAGFLHRPLFCIFWSDRQGYFAEIVLLYRWKERYNRFIKREIWEREVKRWPQKNESWQSGFLKKWKADRTLHERSGYRQAVSEEVQKDRFVQKGNRERENLLQKGFRETGETAQGTGSLLLWKKRAHDKIKKRKPVKQAQSMQYWKPFFRNIF